MPVDVKVAQDLMAVMREIASLQSRREELDGQRTHLMSQMAGARVQVMATDPRQWRAVEGTERQRFVVHDDPHIGEYVREGLLAWGQRSDQVELMVTVRDSFYSTWRDRRYLINIKYVHQMIEVPL